MTMYQEFSKFSFITNELSLGIDNFQLSFWVKSLHKTKAFL